MSIRSGAAGMDESTAALNSATTVDLKTETEQSATSECPTETDYTSGGGERQTLLEAKPSGSKKGESRGHSSSNKKNAKKQKKFSVQSGVVFEPCVFGKSKLWLPQVLTSDTEIFSDVLSMSTWEEELTGEEKSALTKLLPTFEENNDDEQEDTVRQLFQGENFHFGNPLCQFGRDLRDGRYRVENVEKQRAWDQLQREEYRLQNSHRLQTMLPEVIIKRQELLEVVQFTSPSEYISRPQQKIRTSKIDTQGKQKYEKLLEDLSRELGESLLSEGDSEEMKNDMLSDDDDDSIQPAWEDRLHTMFDSPTEMAHCTTTPKPVEADTVNGEVEVLKSEGSQRLPAADVVTEKDYMRMLDRMQIIKEDGIEHPEFIFTHITLRDIINRTYPVRTQTIDESVAIKRKQKRAKDEPKSKKKKQTPTSSPKPSTPGSVVSSQDSVLGGDKTSLLESTTAPSEQPISNPPVKLEEGASPERREPVASPDRQEDITRQLPPQGSTEVLNKVQYQVPHSFFALLRKHFSNAMNHKLWVKELQEKVSIWEKSPLSALCPWRPLQLTWSKVVENTLYFLSMAEQGRLVNYVEEEDAWVWTDPMSISNDELTKLFKRWLDLMLRVQPEERVQPMMTPLYITEGTIPEPRMHTDYTVRASTEDDIRHFRAQEQQRFSEPHKPFTYEQHGYESVVGPVKGITPNDPLPASRGREHSLLISDRPSYVTILSLVRDAVARLPNGEGTKMEICHLLRDSQFIAGNPDPSLLAAVSGALDRLHNEKDPSVKFDSPRKLWVYLHRNRSVQDFERIQMEQILAGRTRRASTKPKQARATSVDLSLDVASTSADPTSAVPELSSHGSPGWARSTSPRSSTDSTPMDPSHQMDPNLSTIQSLISESLIKSQLLKKPRSKTPPASLGRSATFAAPTDSVSPPQTGGIQRSLSIPAAWPTSAAGDLIPCDALLPRSALTGEDNIQASNKPPCSSKPRANLPRTHERKNSGGGKSRGKGEKSSRSSKASGSEKKSPTVQLKSGAITVTLPSSALKGQTVRSILASAASITIGNKQGEEQAHPTVQAVRKRLAEKKTKHSETDEAPLHTPAVAPRLPAMQDTQGTMTGMPAIIFRPNQSFIGQSGPAGTEGFLPAAQMSPQPLALVGAKPTGMITGLSGPATSKQMPLSITGIAAPATSKAVPLSLVVSGSSSRESTTVTKQPLLQQGIQMTSLAPGQNIILQMPDGSKFVTSIPTAKPPVRKPAPVKIPRQSTQHAGKAGTTPQRTQARGRAHSAPSQNPYDFKEEHNSPSSSGQTSTGSMEQGPAIPINQPPVQTFALNLVTKPGEGATSGPVVTQASGEGLTGGQSVRTATSSVMSQPSTGTILSPGAILDTLRGTVGHQGTLLEGITASQASADGLGVPQIAHPAPRKDISVPADTGGGRTGTSGGPTNSGGVSASGYLQRATVIVGAPCTGGSDLGSTGRKAPLREGIPPSSTSEARLREGILPSSTSEAPLKEGIRPSSTSEAPLREGILPSSTSEALLREGILPLSTNESMISAAPGAAGMGPPAITPIPGTGPTTPDPLQHSVDNQQLRVTMSNRITMKSSSANQGTTSVCTPVSCSAQAPATALASSSGPEAGPKEVTQMTPTGIPALLRSSCDAGGNTLDVPISSPYTQGISHRQVQLQEVTGANSQGLPGSSASTATRTVSQLSAPDMGSSPSRVVRQASVPPTGLGRSSKTPGTQKPGRVIRQLPPRHQAMTRVVRQVPVTHRVAAPSGVIVTRTRGGFSQLSTQALQTVTRTGGSPNVVVVSSGQPATRPSSSVRPVMKTPIVRGRVQSSPSRGLARRGLMQARVRGAAAQRPHSSPGILRKPQDPSRKTVVINPPLKLTRPDEYARTASHQAPKRRTQQQQRMIHVSAAPSRVAAPQDLSVKAGGRGQGGDSSETPGKRLSDQGMAGRSDQAEGCKDVFRGAGSVSIDKKEGTMKTAKLIKSQELADAVSGDLSEQGSQEQT